MQGIWSLSVPLSGTSFQDSGALAQITFQFIFVTAIIFAWLRLPSRIESVRGAYGGILTGVYFLIAWYILTLFDLFFHEGRLQGAYGYIVIYFPISCVKFAADILILSATHRLVSVRLYDDFKRPIIWILAGEFLTILLLITGLYHLGSLFAHEALWLNVADSDVIDDVAGRKDKCEAAFFIIQFLFALFTLVGSLISAGILSRRGYQNIPASHFTIAATAFLWIRSFSELVVVANYHLEQNPASSDVIAARDFVYGFCTSVFLLFIAHVARDTTSEEFRDPVIIQAEEECRQHILNTVNDIVETHGHAPVLTNVFQAIRQSPHSALTNATKAGLGSRTAFVTSYMDSLEEIYGDLVPMGPAQDQ